VTSPPTSLRLHRVRLLARDPPAGAQLPYSASKAFSDCSPWPTTAPTAWTCGSPLLQQLRPAPVPRRSSAVSSANLLRRQEGAALRRGASTSATGCTSRPLPGHQLVRTKGGPARSTTSAVATRAQQQELTGCCSRPARRTGPGRARRGPQGPRPALLRRLEQDPRRARLPPQHDFTSGLADTSPGTATNRAWWEAPQPGGAR